MDGSRFWSIVLAHPSMPRRTLGSTEAHRRSRELSEDSDGKEDISIVRETESYEGAAV